MQCISIHCLKKAPFCIWRHGAETQECDCRECTKVLIKENIFYLKHGRDLLVKTTGMKQFSKDLPQLRMELPTLYVFKSTNLVMHSKLPSLVSVTVKTYNDAKSKTFGKNDKPKKKKNNNKNMYIWALFLKAKKSLKDNFFSQFYAINLALIINANLCCSRIGIFLALSIFVSYEK